MSVAIASSAICKCDARGIVHPIVDVTLPWTALRPRLGDQDNCVASLLCEFCQPVRLPASSAFARTEIRVCCAHLRVVSSPRILPKRLESGDRLNCARGICDKLCQGLHRCGGVANVIVREFVVVNMWGSDEIEQGKPQGCKCAWIVLGEHAGL